MHNMPLYNRKPNKRIRGPISLEILKPGVIIYLKKDIESLHSGIYEIIGAKISQFRSNKVKEYSYKFSKSKDINSFDEDSWMALKLCRHGIVITTEQKETIKMLYE